MSENRLAVRAVELDNLRKRNPGGELDVTENLRGLPTASDTAAEIRARVFADTSFTASAGISYNKFLAKLASDMRKPNGQFVIPPQRGEEFIESLPVKKFHGVGPVTAEKLNALGVHTAADLKAKSLEFLQQHFGKSGAWYYTIARGEDDRPVEPNRPRKSSGSETTFSEDRVLPEEIEAGVLKMADDVWAWCEKNQKLRLHRHGQNQIRRFPDHYAQPDAGAAGGDMRGTS